MDAIVIPLWGRGHFLLCVSSLLYIQTYICEVVHCNIVKNSLSQGCLSVALWPSSVVFHCRIEMDIITVTSHGYAMYVHNNLLSFFPSFSPALHLTLHYAL